MVSLRQTHTFAELEVPATAYDQIRNLLAAAGYEYTFMDSGAIDMHGIGLTRGPVDPPEPILTELWAQQDERRRRHLGTGGWIGVDLDGTLAHWDGMVRWDQIGRPIPEMVDRVRQWLSEGHEVRIFTARMPLVGEYGTCSVTDFRYSAGEMARVIRLWALHNIGTPLVPTCIKDCDMIEFWDDRAVQVVTNTGRTLSDEHMAQQIAEQGGP